MIRLAFTASALALLPVAATAQVMPESVRYLCDRGVEVPVVYINPAEGPAIVVLTVEGRQVVLLSDAAASGARYDWPSGGSSYVWWSKGDDATLLWRDGAASEETALLDSCTAQP